MINLNDFAKEVHANAVAHGWWDGERSDAEDLQKAVWYIERLIGIAGGKPDERKELFKTK